jgi:hypothetical protein
LVKQKYRYMRLEARPDAPFDEFRDAIAAHEGESETP